MEYQGGTGGDRDLLKQKTCDKAGMAPLFDKFKSLFSDKPKKYEFPTSVESAVDQILSELSAYNRNRVSNMDEGRLRMFHQDFGFYIMNKLRLWTNEPLKQSCCEFGGVSKVSTDQASYIILKEIQNRIKQQDEKEFIII